MGAEQEKCAFIDEHHTGRHSFDRCGRVFPDTFRVEGTRRYMAHCRVRTFQVAVFNA